MQRLEAILSSMRLRGSVSQEASLWEMKLRERSRWRSERRGETLGTLSH